MAALQPALHIPTWSTKLLADGSNERIPAPSTESTAQLTRWITVTMEACVRGKREGMGVGGWSGWERPNVSTKKCFLSFQMKEKKKNQSTHGECDGGSTGNTAGHTAIL